MANKPDIGKEQLRVQRRNLQKFMEDIQGNQTAYDFFYKQAEKHKILDAVPQRRFQFEYYDSYIKPNQVLTRRPRATDLYTSKSRRQFHNTTV